MKKKLMAMIIATSLIGGIGTTTYASVDTIKENVACNNVEYETSSEKAGVNILQHWTSFKNNNVINKVNTNNNNIFKFISIKINNIVVSVQEFFEGILGNKPSIDDNDSNGNNKDDLTIDNIGQDQVDEEKPGDSQDNNNVVTEDNTAEDKPSINEKPDNSQENVDIPSVDVDNSDENVNEDNSNNIENNNSNITLKPDEEEKPGVSVKPENKPNTGNNSNNTNTSVQNSNFMATVEQMIFNKVNEERAKAGVATLSYSTTMEKYARIKSQDMGDNNYFSHNDLQGNLITTKMKADGVSYNAWGENIAYIGGVNDANTLANQFMTNWMNSQGHRENILSTKFTSIGIGVYKIGNKVYATQEFIK